MVWAVVKELSLFFFFSFLPLQLCQDTQCCLTGHPTGRLYSSPQFIPLRVYKHRPQESTWWAKNSKGEERGQARAVFSDCSRWWLSRLDCDGFKAAVCACSFIAVFTAILNLGLQLCHCEEMARDRSVMSDTELWRALICNLSNPSTDLESSRSISVAWPKHCTVLIPFGTGQTPLFLHRLGETTHEAQFTQTHTHTQAFWAPRAPRWFTCKHTHTHTCTRVFYDDQWVLFAIKCNKVKNHDCHCTNKKMNEHCGCNEWLIRS